MSHASKTPIRISIIRSSSIGDVVLATACLDLLSKMDQRFQITWVGKGAPLKLLQESYGSDLRVKELNRQTSLLVLAKELQNQHLVVDLQNSLRSKGLCQILRWKYRTPVFSADKRRWYRRKLVHASRKRAPHDPMATDPTGQKQFEFMALAVKRGLSSVFGNEFLDHKASFQERPRLKLCAEKSDQGWFKDLKVGDWLAIAPGASFPTKQAPLDLYADIAGKLANRGTSVPNILFVGDESDRNVALQLADNIAWPKKTLNLCGTLSLQDTAFALSKAKLLLGNDSSLGHIAEAVGTPSAVLFGPTVEAFGFDPFLVESQAFSGNVGCRPCSLHGKDPCRFEIRHCFQEISALKVAEFIESRFS